MSSLSFQGLDDIARQLSQLEEGADKVKEAMLNAGENTAVAVWRETGAQFGFNKPGKSRRGTGRMLDAISGKETGKHTREIFPQGRRNAAVAAYQNYGFSANGPKGGLKGTDWCEIADRRCEEKCVPVMAEIFYQFIETGNIPVIQVVRKIGDDSDVTKGRTGKRRKSRQKLNTKSTKRNQFFNPNSYWYQASQKAQNKSGSRKRKK